MAAPSAGNNATAGSCFLPPPVNVEQVNMEYSTGNRVMNESRCPSLPHGSEPSVAEQFLGYRAAGGVSFPSLPHGSEPSITEQFLRYQATDGVSFPSLPHGSEPNVTNQSLGYRAADGVSFPSIPHGSEPSVTEQFLRYQATDGVSFPSLPHGLEPNVTNQSLGYQAADGASFPLAAVTAAQSTTPPTSTRHLPDTAIKLPDQPADPVSEAEYAFARHAADSGVKAAFLRYMDSNSVIFSNGHVRNGVRYWEAVKEPAAKLYWQPVFACTANDGQSGFTTGPFEWRKTTADSAVSCGQYTTVWHKNENGEWHFFADLGIGYRGSLYNKNSLQVYGPYLPAPAGTSAIEIDSCFIATFRREATQAFRQVMLPETWLNLNGQHPVQTSAGMIAALQQMPAGLDFVPLAGFMAGSRDLAYVYGYTQSDGKKENYLRIWAYTGASWKLLLQVLRW